MSNKISVLVKFTPEALVILQGPALSKLCIFSLGTRDYI